MPIVVAWHSPMVRIGSLGYTYIQKHRYIPEEGELQSWIDNPRIRNVIIIMQMD
jgi:hypothetical protein